MRTSFLLASALLLLAWAAAEEASLAALSDRLRVLADSLKANKAVSAKQQKEVSRSHAVPLARRSRWSVPAG